MGKEGMEQSGGGGQEVRGVLRDMEERTRLSNGTDRVECGIWRVKREDINRGEDIGLGVY